MKFYKFVVLMFMSISMLNAASLVRGPYLQQGSPSQAIVNWRTDSPGSSTVQYGTILGNLNQSVTDDTSTTEHSVTITGLQANTKYYYSVGPFSNDQGSESMLGGDSDHFFRTHPSVGSTDSLRVWIIGDSGRANDRARAVRDAYYNFTGSAETNVWLTLGDNAYTDGTDAEYQAAVFDIYDDLLRNTFLWPSIGNHDAHTNSAQPYIDIFELPSNAESGGMASGTERYYSFDYANVHFVSLDSASSDLSPSGEMASWLKNDLANTKQSWVVAFFHHAPYSKGSHDSDNSNEMNKMRQNILPILEDYGVDLVFAGHSHSYERSFLIDGHYGSSSTLSNSMKIDSGDGQAEGDGAYSKDDGPNSGTVYTVAGVSSTFNQGMALNHPVMISSRSLLGSVVLDISNQSIESKFLDSNGVVQDYFTLNKNGISANVAPSVSLTAPAQGATYSAPADVLIEAAASDSDGSIALVEFVANGSQIGEDASAPYRFVWNNVGSGSYNLTAKAIDNEGGSAVSSIINFSVGNVAPSVSLTAPAQDASYAAPADILIEADASDSNGSIALVEFFANGSQIGEDASAPYSFIWDTVGNGSYNLTAKATDDEGGSKLSSIINVSVGNAAPSVSLTAPAQGAFYSEPADILIEADASDSDGTIALVELFANGSKIGEDANAPYSFAWDNVGVGTYNLSAKASDNEAAATTSSIRTVTVSDLSSETTTFETRISTGNDDVEENSNGSMYIDSTDIELVNNWIRGDQKVGLRFNNISIPADAVVVNAYIQFQTDEVVNVNGSKTISGEASADAAAFSSTTGDVSNRLLTSSSVSWSPPAWNTIGEAGVNQRTPDLSSVVQEILDGDNWTLNNSMVFVIAGTGERTAESYEGNAGAAALLHIDYEDGGSPSNEPPSVSLTAPNNAASYNSPAEIMLQAAASDSDGSIALVEFFANGSQIGEDASAPYSFVWSNVTAGSYQLTAKATDDQGASEISTLVLVNVEQESPGDTVFEVRISADIDDVEEHSNGSMYTDSTDIELVNDRARDDQVIGLRFRNVAIPQGASISASYIQFTVDEARNDSGIKTIAAHDIGDAPVFTSSDFNVSSRSRTAASVSWNPPSWTSVGAAGPDQQTSDISAILQDIINRSDWISGNNIVIIISGTGLRVAESYQGDASGAALLHVEY